MRVSSLSSSALSKHPIFSQFSQLSQHVDERKPFIYFVLPLGKSADECISMKLNIAEMFAAAQAHFLNVMWVQDEECETLEMQEDGNVFVFDPFGSPGFHYLLPKLSGTPGTPRIEILSPTVLRQVLVDPQQNPFETKDCPVYTLAMKGMIICLSGFKDKSTKDELEQLVKWMNGSLSPSLTKAVTHVVTATAYTPKCIEANKEGIPVMIENWVRQVFKDNRELPVSASDPRYVKFLCPAFYKVNICMSQITQVKKNILKAGIEKNGGQVFSELVKKQTDILVVQNATGDKYKFAQKWNVKCVTPQWVENSIEKGYLLPPQDYLPIDSNRPELSSVFPKPNSRDGPVTSTPAHSMMQDWNMTRCSAIVDDDRIEVEASKANFTRSSIEIHEETMSQLRAITENRPYLDGCKIYVVEYEKCDELKRELNKSGAVRMNRLCEGVTHVIVTGLKLPKTIQDQIKELQSTPYLVTIDWVIQSAKDGNPADEEIFKFDPMNTFCQETFNAPTNHNQSSHNITRARVSATVVDGNPVEISRNEGATGRSSPIKTATTSKTSTGSTSSSKTANSKTKSKSSAGGTTTETNGKSSSTANTSSGSKSSSSTRRSESSDGDGSSDGTQDGNGSSTNQETDSSTQGLLVGITVKVVISDQEESNYVREVITENGGTIVEDNADVAILDPICDPVEKNRADKSYTKYWLFDCLASSALDIETTFNHIPMSSFEGMEEIMKGVVVAVSQYAAIEREYIILVVHALGARYQEVFARKDSADGKNMRSTHLVCKNMDNDKAKAAKRWNVPVVVAEWLTDSFKERKRLEEDRFDPTQVSTVDERTVFMPTPQRRKTINANPISNMSVRSVYPPSTQKGAPNAKFIKKIRNAEINGAKEQAKLETSEPKPSTSKAAQQEPKPSTSKAAQQEPSKDVLKTPPSASKEVSNKEVNNAASTSSKNTVTNEEVIGAGGDNFDDFDKNLPQCPTQEEIDRKMAEFKAMFPYSDDSYERMLEDIQARGIDLDAISPFSSFEERRLCNPDPDSPLLLGLPRHESRALKEQFEIALNRTPNIPRIKVKTPTKTPLCEIRRRFNEMQAQVCRGDPDSPAASSRGASTPKPSLRKVAALNRLSQGNLNASIIQNDAEDLDIDPLAGLRKLGNKRPSDGSPEEEDSKSSKRARKSSNEDSDIEEMIPKPSTSPKENHVPNQVEDNDPPTTSKKPNRMQILTNLIAESQANPNCDATGGSPIKRRSADTKMLVQPDEAQEEIEQPHIGWGDEDRSVSVKGSTVKKAIPKPRIGSAQDPGPSTVNLDNPEQKEEGRKRSTRLRKASSVVNVEESGGRVTRQTRARSRSKSRREDTVPMGHQPMKTSEGKKIKKKKSTSFPVELAESPIFGLSSLDQNDRNTATKIITGLGGSISKAATFDVNSHALITSKLLRSEKVLGCIASGKYILKLDYLIKSQEAGHFLPIDEEFLWLESNVTEDKERELARASYGWLKVQMEDKNRQPMTGMKFCIVDQSAEKMRAFVRLIEAAGGEVVNNMEDATCVIKDDKSKTVVPEGLPVQTPLYLNTIILTIPSS